MQRTTTTPTTTPTPTTTTTTPTTPTSRKMSTRHKLVRKASHENFRPDKMKSDKLKDNLDWQELQKVFLIIHNGPTVLESVEHWNDLVR